MALMSGRDVGDETNSNLVECPECEGTGDLPMGAICYTCRGMGEVSEDERERYIQEMEEYD